MCPADVCCFPAMRAAAGRTKLAAEMRFRPRLFLPSQSTGPAAAATLGLAALLYFSLPPSVPSSEAAV